MQDSKETNYRRIIEYNKLFKEEVIHLVKKNESLTEILEKSEEGIEEEKRRKLRLKNNYLELIHSLNLQLLETKETSRSFSKEYERHIRDLTSELSKVNGDVYQARIDSIESKKLTHDLRLKLLKSAEQIRYLSRNKERS